mmetsp:Transcript_42771/g.56483  ORF Transcript_42771/g.56483 Transcript_42771/m.56483 type:complete len:136 (-) Transcript_42771:20-427(-)
MRLVALLCALLALYAPESAAAPFTLDKACSVCVQVLQEVARGSYALLPNICSSITAKGGTDAQFTQCHRVIAALTSSRDDVRMWMTHGCYKQEIYGAMERVVPCPYHAQCSQLRDEKDKTFCAPPISDYKDAVGT